MHHVSIYKSFSPNQYASGIRDKFAEAGIFVHMLEYASVSVSQDLSLHDMCNT